MISRRSTVLVVAIASTILTACASSESAGPSRDVFYPPPPGLARLQLLQHFSSADDIQESSTFESFVVGDVETLAITRAHGMAWDRGRLLVCDPATARVIAIDLAAKTMQPIGQGQTVFKKPIDIAVAPDGWKYVTDTGHRRVAVFDETDRYQGALGNPSTWRPVGIAAGADRLYVTDAANHQLVVLDRRSGAEQRRIGQEGAGNAEFFYPLDVCFGPTGDVYVSDSFNTRVQRLRPDGSFVNAIGTIGTSPGQFVRPKGIAVDRANRIYAVDAAFENVQILDPEGVPLLFFGGSGTQPGAMNLPAGVEISYDAVSAFGDKVAAGHELEYVVFVSSHTGPYKVNVYGFLKNPD